MAWIVRAHIVQRRLIAVDLETPTTNDNCFVPAVNIDVVVVTVQRDFRFQIKLELENSGKKKFARAEWSDPLASGKCWLQKQR